MRRSAIIAILGAAILGLLAVLVHPWTHVGNLVPWPITGPVSDSPTAPQLLVTGAGDHLEVRAGIGNKTRWVVAGDQLVLAAISSTGDLISWSYSNPFACGPVPGPAPPAPMPGPGPGPAPTPTPAPQPAKHGPLWLTIVYDSAAKTPAQSQAWDSPEVDTAIRASGHHLRLVEQDTKDERGQVPSSLAAYIAKAKSAGVPYLFAVDASSQTAWEGPAPQTRDDMLDRIRRLGGAQ
jgi:hypothetical protein